MYRSSHRGSCAKAALYVLIFLSLSLAGCTSSEPAPSTPHPKVANIQKLLVVPFGIASEGYQVGSTARCSMCGTIFITGPSAAGDDTYMTDQLLTYLRAKTDYTLIPPGSGAGVRAQILSETVDIPERDLLLQMGKKLGADAVVSGKIFRFQQRVGTSYSVETPASVAFSMYLLRVVDGDMIWAGNFDETQQPLSENLLHISKWAKRGGRFLTSEELAHSGLTKVMAAFPVP
ncbi:MAG: hypothetical protein JRJ47_02745 [Deltaproteobacteria bacterium]|nr:hypothetical protein [Deltaproteobacteria bacterium]